MTDQTATDEPTDDLGATPTVEADLPTLVELCKKRGIIFPSSEIYGGFRSTWDYGPLGVELKENIKRQWWRTMVQLRDDVVGLDASILMHPQVWEASGHLANFSDPLVECEKCHKRFREDHLREDIAAGVPDTTPAPSAAGGSPTRATSTSCSRPSRGRSRTTRRRCGCAPRPPRRCSSTSPRPAAVTAEGPVRHRADRQVVPQRDHAGQLHLPHARVRADGDGVLRRARDRRGVAPVLDRPPDGLVRRARDPRENLRIREHEEDELSHYAKRHRRRRVLLPGPVDAVERARGHRQPHRLRPQGHEKVSGQDLTYYDQPNDKRYHPYVIEPAAARPAPRWRSSTTPTASRRRPTQTARCSRAPS